MSSSSARLGTGCYVCYPSQAQRLHYLDLPRMGLSPATNAALQVNQNLRGVQEFVMVPSEHVGEFWMLSSADSERFWVAASVFLRRLLGDFGAKALRLEVSYGNWIVHRAGSPHYHAHVHVLLDNFHEVAEKLRLDGVLGMCPNFKPKSAPKDDFIINLTGGGHIPGILASSALLDAVGAHQKVEGSPGCPMLALLQLVSTKCPALNGVLGMANLAAVPSSFYVRVASEAE
eukprot:RCo005262